MLNNPSNGLATACATNIQEGACASQRQTVMGEISNELLKLRSDVSHAVERLENAIDRAHGPSPKDPKQPQNEKGTPDSAVAQIGHHITVLQRIASDLHSAVSRIETIV